jgi:tRNA 2-thiouridine synthesizing protein E
MIEVPTPAADPNLDDDGFLKALATWNRAMALRLAEQNDLGPLTEDHWRIIEFVQSYYESHGAGPPVVKIAKATQMSLTQICRLFPCGVVKGAYRLAGLPRPPGCF